MMSNKETRLKRFVRGIGYHGNMTLEEIGNSINKSRAHFTRIINSEEENEEYYEALRKKYPTIEQIVLQELKKVDLSSINTETPTIHDVRLTLENLVNAVKKIEDSASLQKSDPAFQLSQEKEKGNPQGTEQRALLGKKVAGKGAKAKNS